MRCRMDRRSFLKTPGRGRRIGLAGPAMLACWPPGRQGCAERREAWLATGVRDVDHPPVPAALRSHRQIVPSWACITLRAACSTPGQGPAESDVERGSPADVRGGQERGWPAQASDRDHYSRYPLTRDIAKSRKPFEFAKDMALKRSLPSRPRMLSTRSKSCARSMGSTSPFTIMQSPRTIGTRDRAEGVQRPQ